jgi:hypothetical protein
MSSIRLLLKAAIPLMALLAAHPGGAVAQPVKALVDSQNYVFQVRSVQPMRGPVHQVTTDLYTLKVTRDKIVSDLPFFGQAYVAPADPTTSPLQFTLHKFDYTLTPGKKQGWTVLIRPKDNKDIQELQLIISSGGYASLQVISANRDAINFNGIVTAPDKR